MSCAIAVLSFAIISLHQVLRFRVHLVETLPTTLCALMVTLFILAFFNLLSLIDVIALATSAALVPQIVRLYRGAERHEVRRATCNAASLAALIVVAVTIACLHGLRIVAYDDFKFWAATVKSLFAQDGYGAPYTNVASAYGDYPPATLLVLWWAEHLVGHFSESALYIMSALLAYCFILPLGKGATRMWQAPLVALFVITLSTAFTLFGVSLEPDRIMAPAYGAALVAATRALHTRKAYYKVQLSLIISAITLTKSVGIVWGVFAGIFLVVAGNPHDPVRHRLRDAAPVLAPALLLYSIWNIYCIAFERTTYLTQEMLSSIGMGPVAAIEHVGQRLFIVRMYLKMLLLMPVNCTNRLSVPFPLCGLSLSAVGYLALFTALIAYCGHRRPADRRRLRMTYGYCVGVALIYYGILLWSYLFMFYGEFGPESMLHMQGMTSHYAEPAIMGAIMLAFRFMVDPIADTGDMPDDSHLQAQEIPMPQLGVAAITTALIISIPTAYLTMVGWHFGHSLFQASEETRRAQEEALGSIVKELSTEGKDVSRAFVADDALDGVGYCYLHYFVSPISTIDHVGQIDSTAWLAATLRDNHCTHAYLGTSYEGLNQPLTEAFGDDVRLGRLNRVIQLPDGTLRLIAIH